MAQIDIDVVKKAWEKGEICPPHWRNLIVNCDEIAYITGRNASSAIRNWNAKENSPLYGLMTKTDASLENPHGTQRGSWVVRLEVVFTQRQAILNYKRGRKPVENFRSDRHKKDPNRKRRRRFE